MNCSCSATGELIRDHITGREIPDSDDEQIRQFMEKFLTGERGFAPEDVMVGHTFPLTLDGQDYEGTAELVVLTGGKPFMTIKSTRGSLVSRESEAIAASRLAFDVQVPFTVVTNGEDAEFIDSLTGKILGTGLEAIPFSRSAPDMMKDLPSRTLADKQREKLTRIYLAFGVFQCASFCH